MKDQREGIFVFDTGSLLKSIEDGIRRDNNTASTQPVILVTLRWQKMYKRAKTGVETHLPSTLSELKDTTQRSG